MEIQPEFVNLPVAGGFSMRAYVARPEGAPGAGLTVFQEFSRLSAQARIPYQGFRSYPLADLLGAAARLHLRAGMAQDSGKTARARGRRQYQTKPKDGLHRHSQKRYHNEHTTTRHPKSGGVFPSYRSTPIHFQ